MILLFWLPWKIVQNIGKTEFHVVSLSSPHPREPLVWWWREPAHWLQVDTRAERFVATQPVAPLLTITSHYCRSHWSLSCSPLLITLTVQFRWPWSHSWTPIPSWLPYAFNGLGPINSWLLISHSQIALHLGKLEVKFMTLMPPQGEGQHLYSLIAATTRIWASRWGA